MKNCCFDMDVGNLFRLSFDPILFCLKQHTLVKHHLKH